MTPEQKISQAIKTYLEVRGWKLIKLHGNKFQSGLPDYIALYPDGTLKWIEIKTSVGRLSPRQKTVFDLLDRFGQPIYVLTSVEEIHYLFRSPNWRLKII